jgi:PAS domain S-box-containing protein
MVNKSFLNISGYKKNELIGKYANEIFPIEDDINTIREENSDRIKGRANSY